MVRQFVAAVGVNCYQSRGWRFAARTEACRVLVAAIRVHPETKTAGGKQRAVRSSVRSTLYSVIRTRYSVPNAVTVLLVGLSRLHCTPGEYGLLANFSGCVSRPTRAMTSCCSADGHHRISRNRSQALGVKSSRLERVRPTPYGVLHARSLNCAPCGDAQFRR